MIIISFFKWFYFKKNRSKIFRSINIILISLTNIYSLFLNKLSVNMFNVTHFSGNYLEDRFPTELIMKYH